MIKLNVREMADKYIQENFKRLVDGIEFLNNTRTVSKTARFGTTKNYTEFEEDGNLRFGGEATVWRDINLGGISLTKAASNQPNQISLNGTNNLVFAFEGSSKINEAHGNFELQHDYKEGTNLSPHIHWYPTNTNVGNVKWNIDYYISRGTKAALSGTISVVASTQSVAWEEIRSDFPNIVGSSLNIGNQIHFRIYRDPTDAEDTYGSDAAIATLGVHYEIDTIGSRDMDDK